MNFQKDASSTSFTKLADCREKEKNEGWKNDEDESHNNGNTIDIKNSIIHGYMIAYTKMTLICNLLYHTL